MASWIRFLSWAQAGQPASETSWGPLHSGQQGGDLQLSLWCSRLPQRPQRGGCPHALSEWRSLWHSRQRVGPGTYFWTVREMHIRGILISAGGLGDGKPRRIRPECSAACCLVAKRRSTFAELPSSACSSSSVQSASSLLKIVPLEWTLLDGLM